MCCQPVVKLFQFCLLAFSQPFFIHFQRCWKEASLSLLQLIGFQSLLTFSGIYLCNVLCTTSLTTGKVFSSSNGPAGLIQTYSTSVDGGAAFSVSKNDSSKCLCITAALLDDTSTEGRGGLTVCPDTALFILISLNQLLGGELTSNNIYQLYNYHQMIITIENPWPALMGQRLC